MANPNPFYIEPADVSRGFGELKEGVSSRVEYLREEDKKKKQQVKLEELDKLIRSGDTAGITSFMTKNPWAREHTGKVMEFKDEQEEQEYIDDFLPVLSGRDSITEYVTRNAEESVARGDDASGWINALKAIDKDPEKGPEMVKKSLEGIFAARFPKRWAAYNKATAASKVDTPTTFKAAWIKANPNATSEQLVAANKLFQKNAPVAPRGLKTWITPEGKNVTLRDNVEPPVGSVPYSKPAAPTVSAEDKAKAKRLDDLAANYTRMEGRRISVLRGEQEWERALQDEERQALTATIQRKMDIIADQYADAGGDTRDLGIDEAAGDLIFLDPNNPEDKVIVRDLLGQSGGDKEAARSLAKSKGYRF